MCQLFWVPKLSFFLFESVITSENKQTMFENKTGIARKAFLSRQTHSLSLSLIGSLFHSRMGLSLRVVFPYYASQLLSNILSNDFIFMLMSLNFSVPSWQFIPFSSNRNQCCLLSCENNHARQTSGILPGGPLLLLQWDLYVSPWFSVSELNPSLRVVVLLKVHTQSRTLYSL